MALQQIQRAQALFCVDTLIKRQRLIGSRASDVNDAQWLQRLNARGLPQASFRPAQDIAELRASLGVPERHTDYAACQRSAAATLERRTAL